MASGKDISWSEGQFVQPHHFQQSFLHQEGLFEHLIKDYLPHAVGVSHLKVSEGDLENYVFNAVELDCRMGDGTRVRFPENAIVESRSFKDFIDEQHGMVEVFVALPLVTEMEPNCLRFNQNPMGGVKYRYVTKMVEVTDLVSGSNPQQVEIKLLNPRILFSGESAYGYDTLKIAEIERSAKYGSTPKLKKGFVPPTIAVSSSPFLAEVFRETGNRLMAKNRIFRSYWKNQNTATLMKARDAFKVQAVASASYGFAQLSSVDRLHPFHLYCKMAEIIGALSLYSDRDQEIEIPNYDHNALGTCFARAEKAIIHLLAMLEEASFESRVFEPKDSMLICPMDSAWFDEKYEHYICFEAKLDESAVNASVMALKVSPESHMALLNQRRIRGMDLEGPVHHVSALPSSPNHHYFRISHQHPLYQKLKQNPVLAIWGQHEFSELTTLYIVEKKS